MAVCGNWFGWWLVLEYPIRVVAEKGVNTAMIVLRKLTVIDVVAYGYGWLGPIENQ